VNTKLARSFKRWKVFQITAVVAAWLGLGGCRPEAPPASGRWDLIPSRSALLIETPQLGTLATLMAGNRALQLGDGFPFFAHYAPTKALAARLERRANQPALIALAPSGSEGYGLWISLNSPLEGNALSDTLAQWFGNPGTPQTYQEHALWAFAAHGTRQTAWYAASVSGQVLISNSQLLIEESLRRAATAAADSLSEPGLRKLRKAADRSAPAQLYLDLRESDALLSWLLRKKSRWGLAAFGDWAGIDLHFKPEEVHWAGALVRNNGNRTPSATGAESTTSIKLPASLFAYGIHTHSDPETPADLSGPRGHYRIGEQGLEPGLSVQFAALTDAPEAWLNQFDSLTTESLGDDLLYLFPRSVSAEELGLGQGSLSAFFIREGIVHACAHPGPLRLALADFQLDKTLGDELRPLRTAQRFFGVRGPATWELLYARGQGAWPARELMPKRFEGFKQAHFSLETSPEGILIQGALEWGQQSLPSTRNAWTYEKESAQKSALEWGPHALAGAENQRFIWIQDDLHMLHCLDASGKLLWQTPLDGPILSKPQPVDAFKNHRTQWIINTPKQLWMIDRLGQPVDGFPVSLPETATAGCSVFDYDNNRSYRILVPCGTAVYNYGVDAQKVRGWSYKASDRVTHSPQHALMGGKDYILMATAGGSVEWVDRSGKKRLKNPVKAPLASDQPYYWLSSGTGRWVGLAEPGKLWSLVPGGQPDAVELGGDVRHYAVSGAWILSGNGAEIRAENGRQTAVLKKRGFRFSEARWLSTGGKTYFLAHDPEKEQLVGFDAEGNELEGFPIASGPDFAALPSDGGMLLLCPGKGTLLYAHRFNPR